jgi:hypothetical protein
MKTCPSCRKSYEDESLVFCLDDGARLVREGGVDTNATWNMPAPGPTVASPRPTPATAQSTLTSGPPEFQVAGRQGNGRESTRGVWPWVFAIVLVLAASGVLIALIMTRGRTGDTSGNYPTPTPVSGMQAKPSPVPTSEVKNFVTPNERPTVTPPRPTPSPMPTKERTKPMFAVLNNISFNGSRITYYQRTSFALCQADCAGNANCKGLTWIRPGAYNPSDPGMCYLMSEVTQRVPHSCCISAVRN